MSIFILAKRLNEKYGLILRAQDSSLSQAVLDAKKELQNALKIYLHGKDEEVKFFSSVGFDLATQYLKMWNGLGDPKKSENNIPKDLFNRMFVTMLLGQQISHNVGHFIDKVKDESHNLDNQTLKILSLRKQKLQAQMNTLGSILAKAATPIQRKMPELQRYTIPTPPPRERRNLNKDEITKFVKTHPIAGKYGLDEEILSELIQSHGLMYFPEEREKLISFINAANRGQNPQGGPELFQKIQLIRQRLAATQRTPVTDMPDKLDEWSQIYTDPAEAKSREMLQQKNTHEQEREEEESQFLPHEESLERLSPQSEEAKRQQEEQLRKKKEEEQSLVSKYSRLTLEQWLRS
jgi:hypothetical protein